MIEYWRIREVLRVFWTTHFKFSVGVWLEHETRSVKYETCSRSNTDANVREVLRVFWRTHLKCSVVFDWNHREARSVIKRFYDRHLFLICEVISSIVKNGSIKSFLWVFDWEDGTHVKNNTSQFNIEVTHFLGESLYCGPKELKLVYQQNFVQNCRVTHFFIPLSIAWTPNQVHPKEKKTIR